jgi:hypothetical protein
MQSSTILHAAATPRVLYRLDFLDPRASAYKWPKAVEILSAREPEARSLIRVNTY